MNQQFNITTFYFILARFVPEDQIWKSSGSMDSGVIVSGSLELEPPEEIVVEVVNEQDEDEDDVEGLYFAKCREGIKLFREASIVSRSSRSPDEETFVQDTSEKNLYDLTDLVNAMASSRLDDQRCTLGPSKKDRRKSDCHENAFRTRSLPSQSTPRGSRKPSLELENLTCKQQLVHLATTLKDPPQVAVTGDTCQWRIHTCPSHVAEVPIIRTEQELTK